MSTGAIKGNGVRYGTLLIHLLAWLVLLGMPLFLTRPDRPMVTASQYVHFMLTAFSFMVVFYVNYLYLISRYLFTHRIGRFLLWNVVLIAAVMMAMMAVSVRIQPPPMDRIPMDHVPMDRHPMPVPPAGSRPHLLPHNDISGALRFLIGNSCLYLLVVGASVAVKMTIKWYTTEAQRKEAEKHFTEAELENLKSQINPHFLFNTLNNIYSLIQIDQDRAQTAVHDLGRTLRYVLYESSSPSVSLRAELTFLNDYISLMKMRLPGTVRLDVRMPSEDDPVLSKGIAPMLFISLVENAFKHGVSADEDCFISIDIHGDADKIVCQTLNSNHPKTNDDRSGSGIGIGNLKRRLELIYPENHTLSFKTEGDVFEAYLEIRNI